MDNFEHYSQDVLVLPKMLLSFPFSSLVTWMRGEKNNNKFSVERHSSQLFMGKQNPLK